MKINVGVNVNVKRNINMMNLFVLLEINIDIFTWSIADRIHCGKNWRLYQLNSHIKYKQIIIIRKHNGCVHINNEFSNKFANSKENS